MPHASYKSEDITRCGQTLYDEGIRSQVEATNFGKYIAVDIETGAYEIADEHLAAAEQALAKHPGAPLYVLRIGYPAAARIGGHLARAKSLSNPIGA